jgi:peptidoglycan/xylan/chitin deacetylase (PgdA/CDA1 family)
MLRIPVLMYHNISKNHDISFGLTLSAIKFEEQLQYLVKKKYKSLFVSELEQINNVMGNSVLLTFDDVTENQLLYALPLLKKHNIKATFFVPFSYLGMTDLWNKGSEATGERIMTIEQLKSLDSDFIELGHHSYLHRKYTDLSNDEIQDDFNKSFEVISKNDLKVYPALAYPYGNYPKKGILKDDFLKLLQKNNIKMAFRIGNRVNSFPFKKIFEIQRIDIKGEDSLFTFKLKLRFGKLKLF